MAVIKKTAKQPLKTAVRVAKNPSKKLLNKNVRNSKGFKNIGRPVIKVGAGIAVGALTGGVGIAAGGLAFTGLSTAGAIAGGISSAAAGGLSNKAFKPIKQVVIPAASGLLAGNLSRVKQVSTLNRGIKLAKAGKSVYGVAKAIKTRKQVIADMHRRAAAANALTVDARALAKSKSELANLKAKSSAAGKSAPTSSVQVKPVSATGTVIAGAAAGGAVAGLPGAVIGAVSGMIVSNSKA